ncbi:hypothetical protein [Nocardioides sp. AE5]|uniref:hypothetical protein n=1 Tax=Nocardioides sp. AE5 TaxID=2962573 RepID=UPI002880C547|nr:hypothetical protein [Nocardioides sp. AE5]MDT0203290.1 hypothetical protein [Nocardioides sp. AE5]
MGMQPDLAQPLDHWFPLPVDQPFTRQEALACGVTDRTLRALIDAALLRRPVRGVFVDHRVPDSLDTRVRILSKVVPPGSFVADRTAGWLHGANMILAPNDHLTVPRVSVFHLPGRDRTRREMVVSGERALAPGDLVEIQGLLVTSPLRTALDLGRFLRRAQALSAMDSLLRLGQFGREELIAGVERFARQRGVRQLRAMAPLADGRSESPGESALRLHWYDAGLPPPELQVPYLEDGRALYYLDMGLPDLRFAAEYDGEEWHSSDRDVSHDRVRRERMTQRGGWQIEVFRRADVYGRAKDADWALSDAVVEARRTFERRTRFL